ncbi:redox-sensing transcriptional repressor Rex [Halanaerobacter jeridensis]|uniref:Redox-sensing transcriptional repressor Rex n=1 Tax=Halanaerobacter jeridensis TaxID=706427 RepID=A0A938XWK2_9FIRM|nr:redox-sensing transcriptional repressor Rex [Halanaerobacter jeridensis]MBM7557576.1 redox-sensing transcriptional repressor [Halanaerobacter jeridensis]
MPEIRTPATTIERLPLYYRCVQKLASKEVEVISSQELGEMIGIPSTQVRKDLSYYGEFGRRGVGYEVDNLVKNLERILGLNESWDLVLVGAGNLGQALVNYGGFKKLGLNINYALDIDENKIGNKLGNAEIHDIDELEELVTENNINIAVLAVPDEDAQQIADRLIEAGVKAIWNFVPVRLDVPDEIEVRNEDLSIGLISLTYYLSNQN